MTHHITLSTPAPFRAVRHSHNTSMRPWPLWLRLFAVLMPAFSSLTMIFLKEFYNPALSPWLIFAPVMAMNIGGLWLASKGAFKWPTP